MHFLVTENLFEQRTIFIIASVLFFRVVLLLFAFLAQVIKIPYYLYKNYNIQGKTKFYVIHKFILELPSVSLFLHKNAFLQYLILDN